MRMLFPLLLAACLLGGLAHTRDAEGASGIRYGIQDDAWLEFGPGTLKSRVGELNRLGFDVVRVTLNWSTIEREPGELRWGRADRLLRTLGEHGLSPVVTLWGTPAWANGGLGPNVAPSRGEDFEHFAREAATRFPFVRHWTIWNEPNKPAWLRPASPVTYVTQILNPAYRGIKLANPTARVAGGVTAPRGGTGGMSPVDFIRRMRGAGARLDAYAHHPYPVFPGDTPHRGGCSCKTITMATLDRLVKIVGETFPRARIWLTEYAYQTNPPDPFGVSLADQVRFLGEAALRAYRAPKVDLLVHYLYRDEPDLGRWQSGLETIDGRAKPARVAAMLPLAQLARFSGQTTVWGQIRPGDGPRRFVLQRLNARRWTNVGGVRTTNGRGFFTARLVAHRGTRLRIVQLGGAASPALVVR